MPQRTLADITIWHWQFYFRSYCYDPLEKLAECWQSFQGILDESVRWGGGWRNSSTPRDEAVPKGRGSFRLASIDWAESAGEARTLEARAMLDVFYVHTGYARLGEHVLTESIKQLRVEEPRVEESKETFLGQAVCLWGEVAKERENEIPALAKELLHAWFGREVKRFELVEFVFGVVVLPLGEDEEFWGLLVWREGAARERADDLLHRTLSQLFMSNLKARASLRQIEDETFLPVAQRTESKLDEEIKVALTRRQSLPTLERGISATTEERVRLAEKANELKHQIATLEINVGNIARLLNAGVLASQKDQLEDLMVRPWELEIARAHNSLRYLEFSLSRAEQIVQNLEATAQVRSTQWERRLAILLGVFVVLGIPQAFPEMNNIYWWWRLLILCGVAVVLWLSLWFWSRRH